MHLSADFYRRRFEDKLAAGDPGSAGPRSGADLGPRTASADAEFVRDAYRSYLKREPDLAGLQYFCDLAEKVGRHAVAQEIRDSDEARRRAGLPPLSAVAPPVVAPAPAPAPAPVVLAAPESVPVRIDESDQPVELADLIAIPEDRAFLAAAYERALGRSPDPQGLEHHLNRLKQGDSRTRLLYGLATSAEASDVSRRTFTWHGRPWRGPSLGARARASIVNALPGAAARRRQQASFDRVRRSFEVIVERLQQEQRGRRDGLEGQVAALAASLDRQKDEWAAQRRELEGAIGALSEELTRALRRLPASQSGPRTTAEWLASVPRREVKTARTPAVIIGAGGHAKVIVDLLEEQGEFELAGCVSADPDARGLLGLPALGGDEALPEIFSSGIRHAFVAIGDNRVRASIQRQAMDLGFSMINAVSRHAVVSARVALGAGIAIMPGAVINVDTVIGDGAVINTGATVDHDCRIGAFAHVGPGSHLAGIVMVEEGAFLGAGSCVIPRRTIGAWSTLGAGSVVVRDVPARVTAAGVPARILKASQPV